MQMWCVLCCKYPRSSVGAVFLCFGWSLCSTWYVSLLRARVVLLSESFCFHGVRLFTGFRIVYDGCGCWRKERIVTVAEFAKRASTGTGEVRVFMALFQNAEASCRLCVIA